MVLDRVTPQDSLRAAVTRAAGLSGGPQHKSPFGWETTARAVDATPAAVNFLLSGGGKGRIPE